MGGGTRRAAFCAADNFCIRVIAGPAPDGGGYTAGPQEALWIPSCAVDNFCIRVTRGWWECTPSTKTFVDLASCAVDFLVSNEAAKRARRSPPASAAPDTLSSATCLRAWRLGNSTLQRDRRKRLAKQHLAGAEDSVDAVYMALAGAAHAQANAAASGGAWSSARLVAEDYVDAVYMVLAAAARAQASAARSALAWNLRPASWAT